MALDAIDVKRAGLRAAAADLDAIAELLDIAGLTQHAVVEFLAARRDPLQQLNRAVAGNVFLVAGDQKRDRALAIFPRLAAMGGEIIQHRRDAAGNPALHVHGAAPVQEPILYLARERAMGPRALVARRHHVGMSGKADVRSAVADTGLELVDVGGAGFAEGDAMHLEAGAFKDIFEHAERAGIGRGYGWAAEKLLGNREGIGHAPRLTRQPGGGPPLCGTISTSRFCCHRGRVSTRISGLEPNRLVLREPFRQYISIKPQMQKTIAIRTNGRAAIQ